jgi:hypothetical protein
MCHDLEGSLKPFCKDCCEEWLLIPVYNGNISGDQNPAMEVEAHTLPPP